MKLWWLSFVHGDRPAKDKFVGALIIRAVSVEEAIRRAWALHLNPGGEIMTMEITDQYINRVPSDWIETRLITRAECEALEKQWITH